MFFLELIYALAIGISISWIWSYAFNTHGPWNSFFWFFMVIFLFSWGGRFWVPPFGPLGWGVAWMPILAMGIFMALLLTAVTPRDRRHKARGWAKPANAAAAKKMAATEKAIETSFDIFFWMLIVVMVAFVFGNYFWRTLPI
jgi:hypothetical protein